MIGVMRIINLNKNGQRNHCNSERFPLEDIDG